MEYYKNYNQNVIYEYNYGNDKSWDFRNEIDEAIS